jgi:hypothetical protein
MIYFQRSVGRHLVAFVVLGGCALVASCQEAHAGVVVSTLPPINSNDQTFPGEQVGAAIQIGSTPIDLTDVVFSQLRFGLASGESFAIFTRNADGTVGSQNLFSDFTLSHDSTSGNTTATANSPFTFQANTSYWLMMLVAQNPGSGLENLGDWDISNSFNYTSTFGVTIPDTNASVAYFIDPNTNIPGYQYEDLAAGLQLFQVDGIARSAAVPAPSALALAATGQVFVLAATWLRRRRGAR